MVTLMEYALLADKVYVSSTGADPDIPGWLSSPNQAQDADQGAKSSRDEGLQCRAFRKQGEKEVVIAFRGTACGEDFKSDAKLALWGIPMRCEQALRLTKNWANDFSDFRVTLTGHSLGGAIAQVVGPQAKLRFVTFNAPGMLANSSGLCANPYTKQNLSLGMNYIKLGDTIGNSGRHVGDTKRVSILSLANLIPLGAHRMTGFIKFLSTYPDSDKDPLA